MSDEFVISIGCNTKVACFFKKYTNQIYMNGFNPVGESCLVHCHSDHSICGHHRLLLLQTAQTKETSVASEVASRTRAPGHQQCDEQQ